MEYIGADYFIQQIRARIGVEWIVDESAVGDDTTLLRYDEFPHVEPGLTRMEDTTFDSGARGTMLVANANIRAGTVLGTYTGRVAITRNTEIPSFPGTEASIYVLDFPILQTPMDAGINKLNLPKPSKE